MCDLLVQSYPEEYRKIETELPLQIPLRKHRITNFLFNRIDRWWYTRLFFKKYLKRCHTMIVNLSPKDQVFLLEYHHPISGQFQIAQYLKKHFPKTKLIALSHLTPSYLFQNGFNEKEILEWEKPIDIQLTLGTSLSHFFESIGIPATKIHSGLHYVDHNYYYRTETRKNIPTSRVKALVIGHLQRNFNILSAVVKKTPFIDWTICSGFLDLTNFFSNQKNVSLKNYLDENSLKQLMNEADVSVNILDDTIGSNVITTSMAMGLAIITSDVGSIRDYCNNKNALFCTNSADSFVDALKNISQNQFMLKQMQMESIKLSSKFHIENIHRWFQALVS